MQPRLQLPLLTPLRYNNRDSVRCWTLRATAVLKPIRVWARDPIAYQLLRRFVHKGGRLMRCPDINRNNRLSCNSYHPPPASWLSIVEFITHPSFPQNINAFRKIAIDSKKFSLKCRPSNSNFLQLRIVLRLEAKMKRNFVKKRERKTDGIETESFYYDYHHAILTKLKYRVWYSISFATTKFFFFLPFSLDRKEKRENTSEY